MYWCGGGDFGGVNDIGSWCSSGGGGVCNFNNTLFNQKSPVHEAPGPGPWHRFIENCLPAYQIF